MSESENDWLNNLIRKSAEVRENAHCPYSKFRVGAALLSDDGTVYTGCNVENACYPVGVCAERTAICKAVSEGHKKFKAIAVITDREETVTPCGLCRQSLREFQIKSIYCAKATPVNGKYEYRLFTLEELLPHSFGPEYLL
ncbi:cytidine deaminase-like [Styela clava]|uniref:cytidine deaminase-like n=1 Tax=Styela clava TaxID=7725 RepID=UPI001939A123|nr:cytidine deaminase-like [Styela clava]XP_039255061.1 cytidine deaminase-like [Styela clava]